MKKVSFICIMLTLISVTFIQAQQTSTASIDPTDPAFRQKFSKVDFDGKFYFLAVKDAVNDYYMADFTRLPGKFERVYFVNLVYKSDKIVNIDADLSQDRVWFMVSNKYSKQEAGDEFVRLLDRTLKAAETMSPTEQDEWMKKNDKFK
jgi:hypothetical protein